MGLNPQGRGRLAFSALGLALRARGKQPFALAKFMLQRRNAFFLAPVVQNITPGGLTSALVSVAQAEGHQMQQQADQVRGQVEASRYPNRPMEYPD